MVVGLSEDEVLSLSDDVSGFMKDVIEAWFLFVTNLWTRTPEEMMLRIEYRD